jgi:hypothetical protein
MDCFLKKGKHRRLLEEQAEQAKISLTLAGVSVFAYGPFNCGSQTGGYMARERKNQWWWAALIGALTLVAIPIFVNLATQYLTKHVIPANSQTPPQRSGPSDEPISITNTGFAAVQIESPFDVFLKAHPVLMEVTGVKVIRLQDGRRVILAVASTPLQDGSSADLLRAEKVCKVKIATHLLKQTQGIQLAHEEKVQEGAFHVSLDDTVNVTGGANFMSLTTAKVEGLVKELPPVGRWRSGNGKVAFLAAGAILDGNGEPSGNNPEQGNPTKSNEKGP